MNELVLTLTKNICIHMDIKGLNVEYVFSFLTFVRFDVVFVYKL